MGSLFTLILAGMFAAMSYRGSLFNRPELFVVAVFSAIISVGTIGSFELEAHWMISASMGYVGGLAGCFFYEHFKVKNFINQKP